MSAAAHQPCGIPVYIAAGGLSSRFGSDKARAELHGKPLLAHIAAQLRTISESIFVVADRAGKYDDLGVATIPDLHPGKGPMAALQAAMYHCNRSAEWILLTSCDLPGIRASWIQQLIEVRGPADQAVAFRGQFWEPMPAIYRTTLLPDVDRRIAAGELSNSRLLEQCDARPVPLPEDWRLAGHVNTVADLKKHQITIAEKRD